MLDDRPVRTPARMMLIVPCLALADVITAEWDAQVDKIDPRTMPMTGFANASLDRVLPALGDFRGQISAYGASDLLCYRAEGPEALLARQQAAWEPLLDWARHRYAVDFIMAAGVMPVEQPARTLAALREAVEKLDPWLLAGLATVTQIGGSLIATLALMERATAAENLFEILSLDELWQAEQWGQDAEAANRLTLRRTEFLDAARYCDLVRRGE